MKKSPKRPQQVPASTDKNLKGEQISSPEANSAPALTAAAQQLGKLGGEARARNLTGEQRTEIAKEAAASRWKR
jgi:hypothetical protein